MDKAEARAIAKSLSEDSSWREAIPDCPCTVEEIKNDERFDESNTGLKEHHPGAAVGYRSDAVEHINKAGETTNPAQQCTYDSLNPEGKLITHGEGAGTPDSASTSSFSGILKHYENDVKTWKALGSKEYNETWKPNNDDNCEANPPLKETESPGEKPASEQPDTKSKGSEIFTDNPFQDENNVGDELDTFIQYEKDTDSELESFFGEESSVSAEVESFTESTSVEIEAEALTETSTGGM